MSWNDCRAKGFVKAVRPDDARIRSLRENAQRRMRTAERLELDTVTCSVIVTLWYDALRELLEALAMKSGYHLYNHVCYASFLREIMNERTMAMRFTTLREIRNRINYYGEHVDLSDAEHHVRRAQLLIERTKELLDT